MNESERTVRDGADSDEEAPRRVCTQLLADDHRYSQWHCRHEDHMSAVAAARRRERQVLRLRTLAVEQVHRTALVCYLRDARVVGAARTQTLREFHRFSDPADAVLATHREFLLAAPTQLCARHILELIGDRQGLDLMRSYELAYMQYFGMFCEQARARQNGKTYLLAALMPEVKSVADRLRQRILDLHLIPARPVALSEPVILVSSAARGPRAVDQPRRSSRPATGGVFGRLA